MQLKIFLIISLVGVSKTSFCMQQYTTRPPLTAQRLDSEQESDSEKDSGQETRSSHFELYNNNQPKLIFGGGDGGGNNNEQLRIIKSLPHIHIIPQIIIQQSTSNAALGKKNLINNNNWLIQKDPQKLSFRIFKNIPIENKNTDLIEFNPTWTLYDVVAYCKSYSANPYFVFDASIFSQYAEEKNFYNKKIRNREKSYLQDNPTNNPKVTLHILCTHDELTDSFFVALSITSNKGHLEQATHKLAKMIMSPLQLPLLPQPSANDSQVIKTILYNFLKTKLMKEKYLSQINQVLEQDPDPEQYGIDKNNTWKHYTPPAQNPLHPQNRTNYLLWSKIIALKNKLSTASSWLWQPFNYFKSWGQWLLNFRKGSR